MTKLHAAVPAKPQGCNPETCACVGAYHDARNNTRSDNATTDCDDEGDAALPPMACTGREHRLHEADREQREEDA